MLTAIGSAYYHWRPTTERLVWDRLPMSMAFGAAFRGAEHASFSRGNDRCVCRLMVERHKRSEALHRLSVRRPALRRMARGPHWISRTVRNRQGVRGAGQTHIRVDLASRIRAHSEASAGSCCVCCSVKRKGFSHRFTRQHFLYFVPDPHGQGSLRFTRVDVRGACAEALSSTFCTFFQNRTGSER